MKFKKKYVVLASLVTALAAAVYINWQLSPSSSVSQSAKELGAASYVSATAAATADEAAQSSALSSEAQSYFSSERTKRQATQDKIIDEANEIFDLEGSSDEEKSEAQSKVEELMKIFTVQDSIESIVKAKGFADCLCWISDEGVTIIVPEAQLDNTSALVIDDAVTSHYDADYADISIVGA